jgi:hypothetical protein
MKTKLSTLIFLLLPMVATANPKNGIGDINYSKVDVVVDDFLDFDAAAAIDIVPSTEFPAEAANEDISAQAAPLGLPYSVFASADKTSLPLSNWKEASRTTVNRSQIAYYLQKFVTYEQANAAHIEITKLEGDNYLISQKVTP